MLRHYYLTPNYVDSYAVDTEVNILGAGTSFKLDPFNLEIPLEHDITGLINQIIADLNNLDLPADAKNKADNAVKDLEKAQLLKKRGSREPPGRESPHGAEELPRRSITPLIELHTCARQSELIRHQRVDLSRTGQPVEPSFGERPVSEGRTPGKDKEQVVEIGGAHPILDSRLDMAVHTVLDRPGGGTRRPRDDEKRQPSHQQSANHRRLFAVWGERVPTVDLRTRYLH